jgi:hypothetical protein
MLEAGEDASDGCAAPPVGVMAAGWVPVPATGAATALVVLAAFVLACAMVATAGGVAGAVAGAITAGVAGSVAAATWAGAAGLALQYVPMPTVPGGVAHDWAEAQVQSVAQATATKVSLVCMVIFLFNFLNR